MKAVIFDLDDTLVASSHLRPFRDQKQWAEVKAHIASVPAFENAGEMLRGARHNGSKVGIVTSSPRWYAEDLIQRHDFHVEAIVAGGESKYGKPGRDPILACMEALHVSDPKDVLAIGDRCIDTASARAASVFAMGAAWGAANLRDLKISLPDYLASNPRDALALITAWFSKDRPQSYAWAESLADDYVWRTNPSGEFRQHISGAYPFSHMRYRYKGIWSTSESNSLVSSFKTKNQSQRRFKRIAARRFAIELGWFLPKGAIVTFVLPAAKQGDPEYDDRWELLAECLTGKGFQCISPIRLKQSTPPAHEADADSELRDPNLIRQNLELNSAIPAECSKLYIVDDVLTKGGHLRAYADFIRSAYPLLPIHCVAWALHTSTHWYEPQA